MGVTDAGTTSRNVKWENPRRDAAREKKRLGPVTVLQITVLRRLALPSLLVDWIRLQRL
jgi:hypothetical protein